MRKQIGKSVQRKLAAGVVGILALSFGSHAILHGAEQPVKKVPNVRHEMVPHVVLPETIQYNKITQSILSQPGFSTAGDYGMVSPYVATYTPFPSYQIPLASEMKTVNQSVYPVSPKLLPKPLPPKEEPKEIPAEPESTETTASEITKAKQDASTGDTEVAPILLASSSEEIVQAVPLSSLDNEVTQTSIFCQKPAKSPAAWSFTSPIFKAASVPTGWGGPAGGYGGYINQMGPRGCATQLGFQPGTGADGNIPPQNGAMPFPYNTFQMGHGDGIPQPQILPNGMVLLTLPPDHSRCGLIRCHGNHPRTLLLPPAPAGVPGMGIAPPGFFPQQAPQPPQTNPAAASGAMMFPNPFGMSGSLPYSAPYSPAMSQPQLSPVVAMTPYGLTVVGYQQVPALNQQVNLGMNGMGMNGWSGMGMMPAQQLQALQFQTQQQQLQQQQLQQLQVQQFQALQAALAGAPSATPKDSSASAEGQEEAANELQAPLPINSPISPGLASGLATNNPYVIPYHLYAQQFNVAAGAGQGNTQESAAAEMTNPFATPMLFSLPQQANYNGLGMVGNPYMNPYSNPYAGAYMTPYGMMVAGSPATMGGFGNGMMPVGFQPGQQGFPPGLQPGLQQGGLNLSDVVQLIALLNNNNQKQRRGLLARISERRDLRRERNVHSDPLNQLMQAWTTPYMATDSAIRMPSRSAYPYGYFGAQVGDQSTANYGGYYNLYMGNTSYPGLY
jgi:hypothetical protein